VRWLQSWLGVLALLLVTGGCRSSDVPMNQPLRSATPNTIDRLQDANAAGGRSDLLVIVSFSGGGKRSAAFGHGVLRGMRDVPVRTAAGPSNLLAEVDQVNGVSGGSFPAAHFAVFGERSFETFPEEFLYQDVNAYIWGTFLLPWNWEWLVNPLFGTNDRMAQIYDRLMFRGATYAALGNRGRPAASVNATDISFGLPFAFTAFSFDLICSDLSSFSVARAVAASNGFPVIFSPVTLRNYRDASCRLPPPVPPRLDVSQGDFRTEALAHAMERYLDADRTRWIHLMDGGIADNLALRSSLNLLTLMQQQSPAFGALMQPIRRILLVSVDGQAATNPDLPQQRVVTGLSQVVSAASGAQIDNFNIETLMLAESELAGLVQRIQRLRCQAGRVVNGTPCDDVRSLLVRISLSSYPDEAVRRDLQAIPTGLTIDRRFVDQLVSAGEKMVREDATLAAFLQDEPVRGMTMAAAPPRRARR
jgi:NTE family protein